MNELDLTQPFVSSTSMTTTMFMKIHVEADGQSGDLEQTVTMETTVSEE